MPAQVTSTSGYCKKKLMQQEDYILREIEKIGVMFRALIGRLSNSKEDFSLTTGDPFEKTKVALQDELGFDLDKFLTLDEAATNDYLLQFQGINSVNMELLAELMAQLGRNEQSGKKRSYLEKALQLYKLCEKTDRTFSLDREKKIEEIKGAQ
jgi:hypothetical protein